MATKLIPVDPPQSRDIAKQNIRLLVGNQPRLLPDDVVLIIPVATVRDDERNLGLRIMDELLNLLALGYQRIMRWTLSILRQRESIRHREPKFPQPMRV